MTTYRPVTFNFTHGYDLLTQVISFGGSLLVFTVLGNLFGWGGLVVSLLCAIVVYRVMVFSRLKHYLYARLTLRAPVSWADCREFGTLFAPDPKGHWYTMATVRQLPRDRRRDALMEAVQPDEISMRKSAFFMNFRTDAEREAAFKLLREHRTNRK